MPLIPHMRGIRPCGRVLAACSKLEIKTAASLQHAAQTEVFDSPVPCRRAQTLNDGRILREELQFFSKPAHIPGYEQAAIDVVFNYFGIAAHICRQEGQA